MRPEPIRFVRLDSELAQSYGKSVNRRLSVVGHGQRSRFLVLTKRGAASGDENAVDLLIRPDWILTAAHCISDKLNVMDYRVRAGDWRRFYTNGTEQARNASKVIEHARLYLGSLKCF